MYLKLKLVFVFYKYCFFFLLLIPTAIFSKIDTINENQSSHEISGSGSGSELESEINLDGTPIVRPPKKFLLEGGVDYSIGSGIGWQPELAGYYDLPGYWQTGIHTRMVFANSQANYDLLPQVNVEFRKMWVGEEGASPLINSEYISFSIGSFFGYTFDGAQSWFNPIGSIAMGKYWMPVEKAPLGLDLSLELSRLFSGHLQGFSQLTYVTTCIRVFYILP